MFVLVLHHIWDKKGVDDKISKGMVKFKHLLLVLCFQKSRVSF